MTRHDRTRIQAQFFGIDQGKQCPADQASPFWIVLAHRRTQRLLRNYVTQDDMILRRGKKRPLCRQGRAVTGKYVALPGGVRRARCRSFRKSEEGDLEIALLKEGRGVAFSRGAADHADPGAIELKRAGRAK